jgi:hypothetical protein
MQFWLHEVIAPQSILRNVGFALLVVASGMSSMLLLRLAALAAGVVFVLIYGLIAYDPVGLFWMAFFVLMNGWQLFMLRSRKFGKPLDAEQEHFRQAVTPELHPGQVRRLLTAGKWVTSNDGRVLTRQDKPVSGLFFIKKGQVDILVDGAKVAELGSGALVGEIGISTGESSTATSVCVGPVRLLEFRAEPLYRLLDSHKDLLEAIEGAVQRSLREKLRRTNAAVAHPERVED